MILSRAFPRFFVLLGVALILGSCDNLPNYYYKFSFEAEVEGESFALTTRVACTPRRGSSGNLKKDIFNPTHHYRRNAKIFGKQLRSGKGFFVVTPELCGYVDKSKKQTKWTLPKHLDVIPLMFFSDRYDRESEQIRLLVDPFGPDQETGVRLISATVGRLEGKEVSQFDEIPSDPNNPLIDWARGGGWFCPLSGRPWLISRSSNIGYARG